MPTLTDIVLGKLVLRRGLVDPPNLDACLQDQRLHPTAPLGQLLVRRRLLGPNQLLDLLAVAARTPLACQRCALQTTLEQLDPAAGTACPRCRSTLAILLEGIETSDRFTTGNTGRVHPPRPGLPSAVAHSPSPLGPASPTPSPIPAPRPVFAPETPGPSSLSATKPESKAPNDTAVEAGTASVRLRALFTREGASTRFAGYEILGELGRGGMGVVYKARQANLDRIVALKILLAGELASKTQVRRFQREAELTARLKHPGVVQVHDVGQVGDFHYFTMDFVDGPPLSKLIKERKVGVRRAVELARDVARALDHAHRRGAIHRDVKPANILIAKDGAPVLTDFGLALASDEEQDERLTRSGAMVGTPYYMSPEQARGKRAQITGLTDVYSLGVVLFELLTFELPFTADTQLELTTKVLSAEPPRPTSIEPAVDEDVETIVLKALAKEPKDRFASAGDMADELDRYLRGEPILSRPEGAGKKLLRRARRDPRSTVTIAVAGAAVAVASFAAAHAYAVHQRRLADDAAAAVAAAASQAAWQAEQDAQAALRAREAERRAAADVALAAVSAAERTPAGDAYRGAVDEAIAALGKAIELDPDAVPLRVARARLAERRRQGELLEADAQKVLALDPGGRAAAEVTWLRLRALVRDERGTVGALRKHPILASLDSLLARLRPDAGAWRDLLEAAGHLLRGELDAAAVAAARARSTDPSLADAVLLEARVFVSARRVQEALRAAERAVSVDAKDPLAWLTLAQVHGVTDGPPRAGEDVARALEIDPDLPPALELRAQLHYLHERWEEALRDLRRIVELRGEDADVLMRMALILEGSGRAGEAEPLFARAERLAPEDPRPYLFKALRLILKVEVMAAADELVRGLKAVPPTAKKARKQVADLLRHLAIELRLSGHLARAGAELASARPDDPLAEWLSCEAAALKRDGTAADRLDRAVRRFPDDVHLRALRTRVVIVERPAEGRGALHDFEAFCEGNADALSELARLHLILLQEPQAARAAALRAIALDPSTASAHVMLGLAAQRVGDLRTTRLELERAVELDPDDPEANAILGALLFNETEDYGEAMAYLTRALDRQPLKDDATQGMILCLLKLERPREALTIGNRYLRIHAAADVFPSLGPIEALVEALLATRQTADAIQLVTDLLRSLPDHEAVLEQRSLLEVLLARAYRDSGQGAAARQLIDSVLARDPGNREAIRVRDSLGPPR